MVKLSGVALADVAEVANGLAKALWPATPTPTARPDVAVPVTAYDKKLLAELPHWRASAAPFAVDQTMWGTYVTKELSSVTVGLEFATQEG
ncbi:hypothetical protein [Aestuariimicrobium ganziense]|uniref:hypothetical protein n=1 Tax=Aestuariimicrobium ganziense TaxID=2773677 RepID=UPI001940A730|nr:hypothetical protein [Aestuariimicrobium ganziense]